MANELTVVGIGHQGQPDAALAVETFTWSVGTKQFAISSPVSVFSAQIAVWQMVADPRDATLRCVDAQGTELLKYICTGATAHNYSVSGSSTGTYEQYMIECASLEMISGDLYSAPEG